MRRAAICSALVVLSALCSGRAVAGEYQLILGVDQLADYDDNVDFTRDNETAATSYTLTPLLKLDGQSERWDLGVDLATPFERYTEDRLDSDNQQLDVQSQRRLERGDLIFTGGLLRDSTHRAEEESSGLVAQNAQRYVRETFGGSWNRRVGELNQISVGGNAQSANYASGTQLHDYDYGSLQLGWSHVINPRVTAQVNVFDSHLSSEVDSEEFFVFTPGGSVELVEVAFPDSETDTVGVQGGLTRVFNERLRGSFLLGWRNLDTTNHAFLGFNSDGTAEFLDVTASDNGGLSSANITYVGKRFELTTELSRDLTPSGVGVLFERDELSIDFEYQVRERLWLRVHALAYDNDSTDETQPFSRQFYFVRPQVRWRVLEHWTLTGGFDVRNQDLEDTGRATSHSVFLALNYETAPIPVFR